MPKATQPNTTPPDAALLALDVARRKAFADFDAIEFTNGILSPAATAAGRRVERKAHNLRARILGGRAATPTGAALQALHAWGVTDHILSCNLDYIETAELHEYLTMLRTGLASIGAVLLAQTGPVGDPFDQKRLLALADATQAGEARS